MPQKADSFDMRVSVYQKVIDKCDFIENKAVEDLSNNSDWLVLNAAEERVRYQFNNGDIDADDLILILNGIQDRREKVIECYVNSNLVFDSVKRSLNDLKKTHKYSEGFDKMYFDTWMQIKFSRQLASEILCKLVNSDSYSKAKDTANDYYSYQRRKLFR